MKPKEFGEQIESLAALNDPARRRLYLYVVGRGGDVSRDEAAGATRISRSLAAFHLDKLVDAGLLETTFRRLSARSGPGAGRPSKLYRRAATRIDVTLPERRYELAAHVLAQALAESTGEDRTRTLQRTARDWGMRIGRESAEDSMRGAPLTRAAHVLQTFGFEPQSSRVGEVVLRNCPFDSLRADRRELICGMNLALIEGVIEGLGVEGVEARAAPSEGRCCVALRSSTDEG